MELNDTNNPSWLVYQRCVAAFIQQEYEAMDITVQPNVYLVGGISGLKRQIDVLVDGRRSDRNEVSKRIIVDAKQRTSKIDINDVESFEGMMRDCNATNGILISTGGFTSGAIQRANNIITLKLLTFDDAKEFAWVYKPCLWANCDKGFVLWDSHQLLPVNQYSWLICQSGICDVCHSFHVWCQGCGSRFCIADEQSYRCHCNLEWYSLIEMNENDEDCTNWLVLLSDEKQPNLIVVNRKPII